MKPKAAMTSNQMTPGVMINLDEKIYCVESAVKVKVAEGKGNPFIKTRLKDLVTGEMIEKNFGEGQVISEVHLEERVMEFLYIEGKGYLFIDINTLEQILIPKEIIGDRINYIKEGIQVKAKFYGDNIFSIELPQFLELMVVKTSANDTLPQQLSGSLKPAYLETGAKINVPSYIEAGDIIKVDTTSNECIQRV